MANPFDLASSAIGVASQFAPVATGISDLVSGLATGTMSGVASKVSPGSVLQTEKLYTVRSRAASTNNNPTGRGPTAYIKVLTSQTQYREYLSGSTKRDLSYKSLVGSGGDLTTSSDTTGANNSGYNKFLLTGISGGFSEKVQITEVFGDHEVVYYFGRQPMMFNMSGLLIDSPDNDWFTDWLKMYSDVLRGTQLAKNYELVKIVLPNMILTGSITAFNFDQNAARDTDIPFSFQFLAKLIEPVPAVATGMPTSNLVSSIDFSKASSFMGQSGINSLKGQIDNFSSVIKSPVASLSQKSFALQAIGTGVGGSFGSILASGGSAISSFGSMVDGWTSTSNNAFNSVATSPMFQTVTASLNGIRANLFSPIYGVLSSLTKLVTNTFGNATSLFNSVVGPVRNILRDITNISSQAIGLVNLVNSSITGFGRHVTGQIRGVEQDYKTAIQSLSLAAGVIATAPATSAQSIAHMFSTGAISANSPFLINVTKTSYTRPSLSSGKPPPVSKAALLKSVPMYTPATSNSL